MKAYEHTLHAEVFVYVVEPIVLHTVHYPVGFVDHNIFQGFEGEPRGGVQMLHQSTRRDHQYIGLTLPAHT